LEKKKKSRTSQLKRRLFKVGIVSFAENSLGDQEDASNQGRNIAEFDQDKGISFIQEDVETQGRYGHDIEVNTASTSITTSNINITTIEPVTTLSAPVTVVYLKTKERGSKEKSSETAPKTTRGVIMKESSETATRPTVPPQQQLDPKDKAQLQAELKEEEWLAREREEEASNVALIQEWDSIEARIDVDAQL
ncbi:hypothetical protein Tco_0187165, partial [Tanacetum coccineum]